MIIANKDQIGRDGKNSTDLPEKKLIQQNGLEPLCNGQSKQGVSDTLPKSGGGGVTDNHPMDIEFERDYSYDCHIDYLTFFGRNLKRFTKAMFNSVVDGIAYGDFFKQRYHNHEGWGDFEVAIKEGKFGQCHEGSPFFWNKVWINSAGVELCVAFYPDKDDPNKLTNRVACVKIEFKGSTLKNLFGYNNQLLLAEMTAYLRGLHPKFKASRADISVDLPYDDDLWQNITDAYYTNSFAPYLTKDHAGGGKYDSELKQWVDNAETKYFGSMTSRKYLMVYNTKVKHGFERIRFENKCRYEVANEFLNTFEETWLNGITSTITNRELNNKLNHTIRDWVFCEQTISFIDTNSRGKWNGKKGYIELSWFTELKDKLRAEKFSYRLPKREISIHNTTNWIGDKVFSTMALLIETLGVEVFTEIGKSAYRCQQLKKAFLAKIGKKDYRYEQLLAQIHSLGKNKVKELWGDEIKLKLSATGFFEAIKRGTEKIKQNMKFSKFDEIANMLAPEKYEQGARCYL